MDTFFPDLYVVPCALGGVDGAIWSQFSALPLNRLLRWLSSVSWDTQPNCIDSFNKVTDPFPPLFFDGLPVSLSMSEQTFVGEFASRFRYVILTYGRMPKKTRRIRAISFEVTSARFLTFPSWRTFSPGTKAFGKSSSVNLCLRLWSRRGRLCLLSKITSLLKHTVHLLSTENILPFSSPRWHSSHFDCCLLSPSLHSWLQSCASWSSDQYVFLPLSSIFDRLALFDLDKFRGHTLLIRSAAGFTYSHLVQHLHDIFLKYVTCR